MTVKRPASQLSGETVKAKRHQIGFALKEELLARIDALIPSLSTPWFKARRSDVLRALVVEALPTLERRAKDSRGAATARRAARSRPLRPPRA
jgi:hypothetical protein